MKNFHTSAIRMIPGLFIIFFTIQQAGGTITIPALPVTLSNQGDPVLVDTLDIEVMDPASGVQFYRNGVIILSSSKYQHNMVPDHISFGQTGTFLVTSDDLGSYPNNMFISGNPFPVDPVAITFSPDFKTLYYSASGESISSNEQIFTVPVSTAQGSDQVTFNQSDVMVMPFCDDKNNYMHPALSADNSFMIFSSDNSKSTGGFDLFIVRREGNKWGTPVNMGKSVNTLKDELYSFLDKDNNLYFSSDGHSGFGGMDIYMCSFTDDKWGGPINLMKSFNSEYDDVALRINPENRAGYFTSVNRPGDRTKQLYRISINQAGKLSDVLLVHARNAYKTVFGEDIALTGAEVPSLTPAGTAPGVTAPAAVTTAAATTTAATTTAAATTAATTAAATTAATTAAATTAAIARQEEKPAKETVKEPVPVTEPVKATEEPAQAGEETKDEVIFRVQITSSTSPKSNYKVTISGRTYPTFEYLYKGAYRYTVGEFRTVSEANVFRDKCKTEGFSQAFVAAFKNNERVTDPAVFK